MGRLLERPELAAYFPILSRPLVAALVRAEVGEARSRGRGELGERPDAKASGEEDLVGSIAARLAALARRRLRKVLNGTGVLLHTNLGRAPLGSAEWAAAAAVNTGYSNLELELEEGRRGARGGLVPELAAALAGSEAALALNNNAAALLLALRSLASGREVVVSRGEQVQIGGGFRIPEILALSGARMVEVGTTNVTTVQDYLAAIGPDTACLLQVHPSNFAIRGFTSRPGTAELVAALPPDLPLLVDQGSGCHTEGLPGEQPFRRLIREGASLVCFSADKLLGGPQAGIAAGKASLVRAMARDPLARALRPGKTVLSLLEERLVRALNGDAGAADLPDPGELEAFGKALRRRLPRGTFELLPSLGRSGGGSSPDETFPSLALAARADVLAAAGGAELVATRLRSGDPPLVATIREGRLFVDLAALRHEDTGLLAALLGAAMLGEALRAPEGNAGARPGAGEG